MSSGFVANFPKIEAPDSATPQLRMRALIENLSAYIEHFHGGTVEMMAFDGDELTVRMGGACDGCNLAQVTLHGWIEGTARQFFPDLKRVIAV